MYSYTEENYLKAIYKLTEAGPDKITTNAIAQLLETKAASVTDMIKKLAEKNLLDYEKYKGVTLSESGRRIAITTVRKHRLWEVFLHDKLMFGWEEVHDIAEQLEHIHSESLIDKLDAFLGYPSHDPHGDPIPTKKGEIKESGFVLLSSTTTNQQSVMAGVCDHRPAFLKYLDKTGLILGKQIEALETNEFDGSMKILLDNSISITVTADIAKNILVKRIKKQR